MFIIIQTLFCGLVIVIPLFVTVKQHASSSLATSLILPSNYKYNKIKEALEMHIKNNEKFEEMHNTVRKNSVVFGNFQREGRKCSSSKINENMHFYTKIVSVMP